MEISFMYNKNKWRIFTIYNQNVEEILKVVIEEVQENEDLVIRDFNARMGNERGPIGRRKRKKEKIRRLGDKIINKEMY